MVAAGSFLSATIAAPSSSVVDFLSSSVDSLCTTPALLSSIIASSTFLNVVNFI